MHNHFVYTNRDKSQALSFSDTYTRFNLPLKILPPPQDTNRALEIRLKAYGVNWVECAERCAIVTPPNLCLVSAN